MDVLWSERHRPESFEALDFHPAVNELLSRLAASPEIPHLVLYGPDGAGKRTRVACLLQRLFGGKLRTRKELWSTKHNGAMVEVNIRVGPHHTELTPSDAENNDRIVLNKLIKETASNATLLPASGPGFTVFVLYDAENMSLAAQASLRRTLEKYSAKVRLVLVCETVGKLIPALKSRCLLVRVPAPSDEQLVRAVRGVADRERVPANDGVVGDIVRCSGGNLRKALLDLQAFHLRDQTRADDCAENWRTSVREGIVARLLASQAPETVKALRGTTYQLLVNQVPADEIIAETLAQFLPALSTDADRLRAKEIAAELDAQMKQGDREVIFIESLIVKFMLLFKNRSR